MSDPVYADQRQLLFMEGLFELCRKWDVTIDGCGCCGSPSIESPHRTLQGGDLYASPREVRFDWSDGTGKTHRMVYPRRSTEGEE